MPIANEELDALDRLAKAADESSIDDWYSMFSDINLTSDDNGADMAFIGTMSPATAQRLTATIREQAEEIERLKARVRYCDTMDEAEKMALVRALQELAEAAGLSAITASPSNVVEAVKAEIERLTHIADNRGMALDVREKKITGLEAAYNSLHKDAEFSLDELMEIQRAISDFDEVGETDVADALLLRAVHAGYLECEHYLITPDARDTLSAAIAAQGGGAES